MILLQENIYTLYIYSRSNSVWLNIALVCVCVWVIWTFEGSSRETLKSSLPFLKVFDS